MLITIPIPTSTQSPIPLSGDNFPTSQPSNHFGFKKCFQCLVQSHLITSIPLLFLPNMWELVIPLLSFYFWHPLFVLFFSFLSLPSNLIPSLTFTALLKMCFNSLPSQYKIRKSLSNICLMCPLSFSVAFLENVVYTSVSLNCSYHCSEM